MIGSSFIDKHDNLESLPLVPLRDIVVFPYTMVPFVVGRRSSLLAVEQALLHDKKIFLATQRDAKVDNPEPDDINVIGTTANIVQSLKLPNGNIQLLGEFRGHLDNRLAVLYRGRIDAYVPDPHAQCENIVAPVAVAYISPLRQEDPLYLAGLLHAREGFLMLTDMQKGQAYAQPY